MIDPILSRRFLPLMALLAMASGCTQADEGPHLSDSRWRFALIDGRSPISDAADLRFADGEITVVVGCNRISGPWRVSAERLVAGPLAQTEMTCPAPAWDQEKAIGALLAATPRLLLDDDKMTLQSGGHTAELVREDGR